MIGERKPRTMRQFWKVYYLNKERYAQNLAKWKAQGKVLFNGYPIEDIFPELGDLRSDEKRDREDPRMLDGMPVIKVIDRVITLEEMNEYLAKGYFVHRDPYRNKTYIAKEV